MAFGALAAASEIRGAARWQGEVTVADTIRVRPGATLVVAPGTTVTFADAGRMVFEGRRFEATGALFQATTALVGQPRFLFRATAPEVIFERCTFRGLKVTECRAFFNSFFVFWYGQFAMRDCLVQDASPIEICHATGAVFTGNRIERPASDGLILAACDRALVHANHFGPLVGRATALRLINATNCRLLQNRIFGASRAASGISIGRGAHSNEVIGNAVFGGGIGIRFWARENAGNALLSNLVFGAESAGIRVDDAAAGITLVNCVVWGGGTGLDVADGEPLAVRNCVFAGGRRSLAVAAGAAAPTVASSCFWNHAADTAADRERALALGPGNSAVDPLFVAPAAGNFRLRTTAFGYPQDSPLLGTGSPAGTSIGLFPFAGP